MTSVVVVMYFFEASMSGENVLQWKTAYESNSNYFSLEHSSDGITWLTASIVPAAGNSTEEISYSETHRTNNQIDYYRFRQFDLNGDFKTYQTISVYKSPQGILIS